MSEKLEAPLMYVNAAADSHQKSKEGILKELLEMVNENSSIPFNVEEVFSSVKEREALSTTGFGEGFAIPHGKSSDLKKPLVAVMKLPYGVDWEAMDEEQVDTVILLIVPEENGDSQHLKLLSQLSYNLMDKDIQRAIRKTQSDRELHAIVQSMLTTT